MTRPAMATRVGAIELPNPVMTASGTAGHGAELSAYFDLSAIGAVVVKSLTHYAWDGNPPLRVHSAGDSMINSVGLAGPGLVRWAAEDLPGLVATGARVVVSIWGASVGDFRRAAELCADLPAEVVAVEVNLSCPNTESGRELFAHSTSATRQVMAATAAAGRPRWAKLSPNTDRLVEIAEAARMGGAEAVTLVNTLLGMALDPRTGRYRLGSGPGGGGLSGSALHPVAVRAVHDVHQSQPDLPIVGVGGVAGGEDALELIRAGASAVQVGTATFADPRAAARVSDELGLLVAELGTSISDLVGRVHPPEGR